MEIDQNIMWPLFAESENREYIRLWFIKGAWACEDAYDL